MSRLDQALAGFGYDAARILNNPRYNVELARENEAAGTNLDPFNVWKNLLSNEDMVPTKGAKQDYFLSTDDLAELDCYKLGGGIGCGPPMKMYKHKDLVRTSLAKHRRDGILKKLEAKQKREEKKREKQEQAEEARKRMKTITNTATSAGGEVAAAASAETTKPAADTQEIKKLRGSLLKMAKKKMGFERSGAPKHWRIEVPGTSEATFAALMGRPTDVDLASFVKNGAYYTVEQYEASTLFGTREEDQLTKDFKREGVTQKIGSAATVRYKPSSMEFSVSGYAMMHSSCYGW